MRMRVSLGVAAALVLLTGGCGGGDTAPSGTPEPARTPFSPSSSGEQAPRADEQEAAASLGFPGFATKNTTRVGGADPVANAVGVALAVYPSASADSRPRAVSLVDVGDWRAAISAAQLMSRPLGAPVLLSQDGRLPPATAQGLDVLRPRGAGKLGGAGVVRIGPGAARVGSGAKTLPVTASSAAGVARSIDQLHTRIAGSRTAAVIVAPSRRPAFAMPAAGLAVKTGAPVLWSGRDRVPDATLQAIRERRRPRIYVIGPAEGVGERAVRRLRHLGPVERIAGVEPVSNAVAVARYADGGFGWNVVDPGHGLVFASGERTADAAAAAALSGSGAYGPLLLVSEARTLPAAVQSYLLDIQPGYDRDPVRGVYNHAWLMGDANAISTAVQARIDSLLEIQPVDR